MSQQITLNWNFANDGAWTADANGLRVSIRWNEDRSKHSLTVAGIANSFGTLTECLLEAEAILAAQIKQAA